MWGDVVVGWISSFFVRINGMHTRGICDGGENMKETLEARGEDEHESHPVGVQFSSSAGG